jgi:uncharacterized cupredoxin-like copper-binding protein
MMSASKGALAAALISGATLVYGHGGHAGNHIDATSRDPAGAAFGRPGDPTRIAHTIAVDIDDAACRLVPEVRVRQGETVRFVVANRGTRMHELVLGTSHELERHAEQAASDADLDHEEASILHVEPGASAALVWRFTRVGLFRYGCLIHGVREFRMAGRILVFR